MDRPISLWETVSDDAFGTFALVFAGCGAIVVEAQTDALGHLGVCAVFGLVVGAMIFATGHISGTLKSRRQCGLRHHRCLPLA